MTLSQKPSGKAPEAFAEAVTIMARLRAPGGCPWDREQDFDSIKRYTLEETYEVFDAIERRDWPELRDELGDLLLQVLFYAQMADEAGHFSIADVIDSLNAKLIRRHPHVFGEVDAKDSTTVLHNWEQIKRAERQAKASQADLKPGLLDEIPRTMPSILEAQKLGSRAAKVGFDWPDASGLFSKVEEELDELRVETEQGTEAAKAEELGDLLFTAVNLARHLEIDAEGALRTANGKFRRRFAAMEQQAGSTDALRQMTPDQLEFLWSAAKQAEAEL